MDPIVTRIISIKPVTHDVKRFRLEKPAGYTFTPGQATEVSINKPGWEEERRPFTFTSLNDDPFLEFTIKRYEAHKGVTDQLHQLEVGDELLIRDVWGAISYKGPGYFIAGGAGITPFLAILRQLQKENKLAGNTLFFSNKTAADIICREELEKMLGEKAVFLLSRETNAAYTHGRIDRQFLSGRVDPSLHFYVCGPDEMIATVNKTLELLGASPDVLVFEK